MYPWSSSGRKLEGNTFPKNTTANAKCGDYHEGQGAFPNQPVARPHVQIAAAVKYAVEPAEEFRQRPMSLFLGPEKQCPERRAQGQGVEG